MSPECYYVDRFVRAFDRNELLQSQFPHSTIRLGRHEVTLPVYFILTVDADLDADIENGIWEMMEERDILIFEATEE